MDSHICIEQSMYKLIAIIILTKYWLSEYNFTALIERQNVVYFMIKHGAIWMINYKPYLHWVWLAFAFAVIIL